MSAKQRQYPEGSLSFEVFSVSFAYFYLYMSLVKLKLLAASLVKYKHIITKKNDTTFYTGLQEMRFSLFHFAAASLNLFGAFEVQYLKSL